jgi:uncharacterized protein YndB with AHSA1/START domain
VKTIIHTVDIQAKADAVFQALTTEKGLARWWTTRVKAEPRVGSVIAFIFEDGFGPQMKVTQLEAPRLVTWECVDGHEPWSGNTFRFEIVVRTGSRLRFRQEYSRELSDDQYGVYNYNWGYYLESLRLYCSTGTGKPFTPVPAPASPAR